MLPSVLTEVREHFFITEGGGIVRSFWIWLFMLAASWLAALLHNGMEQVRAYELAGCAVFFALFFLAPLLRFRPIALTALLTASVAAAAATFWPGQADAANPYSLLIYTIAAGKAVYRLPPPHALVVGVAALVAALSPELAGKPFWPLGFLLLYALILGSAAAVYRTVRSELEETSAVKDALLSEYRRLKRTGAAGEEIARQQERTKIARDMHDSVGHRLTNLLMQLEVFRLQSDGETAARFEALKQYAQESLNETRKAVKALHREETEGLGAIMELIRRQEAENFVRVKFSLGEGVLSVPLTARQSAAIYRAVQEALTNAMRYGTSRQVEIEFEAPGRRVFRFHVSNPWNAKPEFREGFGLSSMRERLEALGGRLHIAAGHSRFIVEGTLPLVVEEGKDDPNIAG